MLLYGESGAGKSSLINAGLVPAAETEGFRADRIRVQPRPGEELVVERIEATPDGGSFLPSSFTDGSDGASRLVLSTEAFRDRLQALPRELRPLLVFDQFEELSTLFEEAGPADRSQALAAQRRIVDLLVELMRDGAAPLKLLLVFREDYLAKVKKLLSSRPELLDQSMRLVPPSTDTLYEIIRGPFERYPGHFGAELSPELAGRLRGAIESRSAAGDLSLSEVQVACLRLWESSDPERLFDEKGVQGLLEDYLSESLDRFPPELRDAAVAVLDRMVTSSGTRNVVSGESLVADVRDEEDIPEERAREALEALERETKLVRRERRRDVDLYEIVSEFLLPWIRRQREERLAARAAAAREAEQRRIRRRFFAIALGLALIVGALTGLTLYAFSQKSQADLERAHALASRALVELDLDPVSRLVLAKRANDTRKTDPETQSALRTAVAADDVLAVLRGHTDAVERASFSPDGREVVTAGDDGTARLWNSRTGKVVHVFRVARAAVTDVGFSPNGKLVATVAENGRVRIWTTAGALVATRDTHDFIETIAFSNDSRRAAVAGEETCAFVLTFASDAETVLRDRRRRCMQAHDVAFSSDGTRLVATGFSEGWIADARTGRLSKVLAGGIPDRVEFARRGTRVLGAEFDAGKGVLSEWDTRTGKRLWMRKLGLPRGSVGEAAFAPDGEAAIAVGRIVQLWIPRTGDEITLRGHSDDVKSVQFSPNEKLVLSSGDLTARLWDAATGASLATFSGHSGSVLDASFSPDGSRVVTASDDETARIWAVRPQGGSVVLPVGGDLYDAAFSPDGRSVVTAGQGARIWNAQTGRGGPELRGVGQVLAVEYLPNTRLVAIGAEGGVAIWRPGGLLRMISRDATAELDVARDGELAAVNFEGNLSILNGAVKRTLRGQRLRSAVFSSDGRRIVTVGDKGVAIWDARTLLPLRRLHYDAKVLFASFSPDGKQIATASSDTTARLWDAATGTQIRVLRGHSASVETARFSLDGRLLVTASRDRTVRVWDVRMGNVRAIFADHTDTVWNAAFSSDGKRIVSAGNDGTARIYTLIPIDELRRVADERLASSVTSKEEDQILAQP